MPDSIFSLLKMLFTNKHISFELYNFVKFCSIIYFDSSRKKTEGIEKMPILLVVLPVSKNKRRISTAKRWSMVVEKAV